MKPFQRHCIFEKPYIIVILINSFDSFYLLYIYILNLIKTQKVVRKIKIDRVTAVPVATAKI